MDANELRVIRKHLGLTQAALAAKLGVGQVTVARWETGVRRISGPVALAIRSLKPKKEKEGKTKQK